MTKELWTTTFDYNNLNNINNLTTREAIKNKDRDNLLEHFSGSTDLLTNIIGTGCVCGLVYSIEDYVILAFEQIQLYSHMSSKDYTTQKPGGEFYNKKKEIYNKYNNIDFDNSKDMLMVDFIISIIHGKGLCNDKGYSFTEYGQWFYNNIVFKIVEDMSKEYSEFYNWKDGYNEDYEPLTEEEKTIDLNLYAHSNCYCKA